MWRKQSGSSENLNNSSNFNHSFRETIRKFSRILKKQKTQLDDLYDLEEKTNRLLIQNQKNQKKQAKQIAKIVSGSSIQTKTLQKAWKSIETGTDDFDKLQKEAHQRRLEELEQLDEVKKDFHTKYKMPKKKRKF